MRKAEREAILRRDDFTCRYCGRSDVRTLHLDHVIPKSKGGPDEPWNLVAACAGCNLTKYDRVTPELLDWVYRQRRKHEAQQTLDEDAGFFDDWVTLFPMHMVQSDHRSITEPTR